MRKVRTWLCPCCRSAWHRRKGDTRPVRCGTCRQDTQAGRSYPHLVKCAHRRAVAKVGAFRESYETSPRCASGHVLSLTPKLRAAWSACRKARTRPALMRRAEAWITALGEESERREGYTRRMGSDGTLHRSRSSFGSVPKLITQERQHGDTLGLYTRAIFRGEHSITVVTGRPLDDVRETLIHEALHYLDGLASISDRGHDCYWRRRMERMRELFPITGWGTR